MICLNRLCPLYSDVVPLKIEISNIDSRKEEKAAEWAVVLPEIRRPVVGKGYIHRVQKTFPFRD